ncbi:D-alanyl-D-alanine carboxypeptidase family protein [Priestia endophytica]|jgi:D-alanyl-D-alanine carboxypeptidase (penicillin-binding protein 5/6)|uniref:serine-type D-Ala-D-Ala carboxypeptidase n=1 Tax=Priestia endophytica DSM 13796 TaxID=1121089 RepID=A0A1I5W4E4_9BACI|nr:D-alanyl-D-alanine carboxypeptidase family protein [Priestia endophytica]KAB2493711.1 D-alanyl-D-alanine carboxypeptidase [Priestia endophytica]KYG35959.1 D-alanyl-D-alanine carboxypeptidase [Priestia endophytica]RAS88611.1 D-alanyl-D-alanine carboxypeptidase [Priestia endophytica]SFQ14126.1 D-alanyl-D-alanine carboxypeptidase (penicillin-binding protein 5/6) [Priestia endophytica DSM 13796]
MKQLFSFILVLLLGVSTLSPSAFGAEKKAPSLAEKAESAILIERDTGEILYEKNGDEKLPPASMTKVMTMILIMDALDKGKIKMSDKVRTSEHAASMGGSQIFLEPGEEMTVEQMLKGIAIASGNDASVAMAEHIAGSEEEFVSMMNQKAKDLGLKNTKFQNPTGLSVEDHYSTAHDMSIMAKELLKYEGITKFTGTYEDYLREDTDKKFWLVNTNRLLKFYDGVDGLKTGYTKEAKYCLTATAKKGNMRVVAVVFGADTPKDRNSQITKMLDYAFSKYETSPLYKRDQVVGEVKVAKGKDKTVEVVTSEPISILNEKGQGKANMKKEVKLNKDLKAPLKKGDEVGTLIIKKDGKVVTTSPLLAKDSMKEASWWNFFKRTFTTFTKTS